MEPVFCVYGVGAVVACLGCTLAVGLLMGMILLTSHDPDPPKPEHYAVTFMVAVLATVFGLAAVDPGSADHIVIGEGERVIAKSEQPKGRIRVVTSIGNQVKVRDRDTSHPEDFMIKKIVMDQGE